MQTAAFVADVLTEKSGLAAEFHRWPLPAISGLRCMPCIRAFFAVNLIYAFMAVCIQMYKPGLRAAMAV